MTLKPLALFDGEFAPQGDSEKAFTQVLSLQLERDALQFKCRGLGKLAIPENLDGDRIPSPGCGDSQASLLAPDNQSILRQSKCVRRRFETLHPFKGQFLGKLRLQNCGNRQALVVAR